MAKKKKVKKKAGKKFKRAVKRSGAVQGAKARKRLLDST